MSVGRLRWTWRSMSSTACWSWDARPTSASSEPRQGRGHCARTPDPCTTAARARGAGSDLVHGAQVTLRQLRFALGREHFRNVEHVRKRRALGVLVFCGLQGVLADDEPVTLAGHALRPAIEAGVFPEVMQRGFQRESLEA